MPSELVTEKPESHHFSIMRPRVACLRNDRRLRAYQREEECSNAEALNRPNVNSYFSR